MNLERAQRTHDEPVDHLAERLDWSERQEIALRAAIEADPARIHETVAGYWTGTVLDCDGQEVLSQWTLALADTKEALTSWRDGEPLLDAHRPALHLLLEAAEDAAERKEQALKNAIAALTE